MPISQSRNEWSNYFAVNIPTGPNETDLSGSNMRLTCTACRLNFTGNKTRAVAHFIGGDLWISKFPVPSIEAVIWARGDRNIANEKRKVHYDQSCTHKPEPTIKGTRTYPWTSMCCCWGFGIFVDFPRWDGCFSTGKALHRCKLSEPDFYTKMFWVSIRSTRANRHLNLGMQILWRTWKICLVGSVRIFFSTR